MGEYGSGAKATAAQRAEVERLAAEGVSVRQIAAAVFGEARYRGRVERILRGQAASGRPAGAAEALSERVEVPELEGVALLRWMFERAVAALAARTTAPSFVELRALLDVERRLETVGMIEL